MKKYGLFSLLFLCLLLFSVGAGESYNVGFLSDMHYGTPDSFAVNPETGKLITKKDTKRMTLMMEDYNAMYRAMAKGFNAETAFVAVGGDLIEGWAKDEATHAAELSSALQALKKELPRPIFCVTGNHDANGTGGRTAFQKVMIPFLREMTGNAKLEKADYIVQKGDDLWIFCDTYSGKKLQWLLKAVRSIQKKPRYLFVVLHENVLQFPNGEKLELRKELEKFNSVILCGHSHRTLLLSVKRPDGCRVSQFSIGSFLVSPLKSNRFQNLGDTPQKLLPELEKRSTRYRTWEQVQKEMVPFWDQGELYKGAGYAMLYISDSGIEIKLQSGDLQQQPISLKLR